MEALFNLGGSLLGGGLGYLGMKQANAQNRSMAQDQMAFQERMSSTAYQRAMEDMRKAGLNPMLAYQQGGASSPSGASMQMQNAIGSGTSSAIEAARVRAELSKTQSEARLNEALTHSARVASANAEAQHYGKRFDEEFDKTVAGGFARVLDRLNPLKGLLGK